jgi:hypothetical protein
MYADESHYHLLEDVYSLVKDARLWVLERNLYNGQEFVVELAVVHMSERY